MKALGILAVLCMAVAGSLAGRAFPVGSENFATALFQELNPGIEWDLTNFLVDLSGQYALCKFVGQRGTVEIDRVTPDQQSIGGLVDSIRGSATDAPSINEYVAEALPPWLRESPFRDQIERSDTFGCSVQPGCNGHVVMACLFSPGNGGGNLIGQPTANPNALAFTEVQYDVAEGITGVLWDRSHYLENLSGFETDCAMIFRDDWTFANAKEKAKKRGMIVEGLYGNELNRGSTPNALRAILRGSKWIPSKKVGCSVIPDCIVDTGHGDEMRVVVSCIYQQ